MDYGSIQTKLEAAGYPDAAAFASDVRPHGQSAPLAVPQGQPGPLGGPAAASGARASRLQGRSSHRP
eukprot:scaffold116071_cov66-Phaeocystis_antarctica.AAC.2